MCDAGYVATDDNVDQEDQSIVAKGKAINCCKKIKIKVLLQRIRWSSAAEEEDQRWRLGAVEYDVLVLKMLKMFQ